MWAISGKSALSRSTFHRQACGPSQKARAVSNFGMVSYYGLGNFIHSRIVRKGLDDLDNQDGVSSHSKSDILESQVKGALGSTAAKNYSGDDGIPAKLFKILKNDAVKCCPQYASKFGKPSRGHRTEKVQSSSQFPSKTALKNVQTTGELSSSPILLRLYSKSSNLGFSIAWTKNFQVFKLGRKGRGTRDQITNLHWITEKARKV